MSREATIARLRPLFERAEREHRELKELHTTSGPASPAYKALLTRFLADTRALETTGAEIIDGLRRNKPEAADAALAFLFIRARPYRSGYACARIARALKRASLSDEQVAALRGVILDRLTWPWAHTPDLWRCYPRVRTTESDTALREVAASGSALAAKRAKSLLGKFGRA
jgi:hypothetical protein